MEIRRFIDDYSDDIYALALISTKDFNSAKQVFIKASERCGSFNDNCTLFDIISLCYKDIRESDSNDSAVTLTGIELSSKQQAVMEVLLQKPQIVRTIIHLFYENDLDAKQIAKITGESERYVTTQLSDLSIDLTTALEEHYKAICLRLIADDSLKTYAISAVEKRSTRAFEVKRDAVPLHTWTKTQKIVVFIVAVIVTVILCIVVPIVDAWIQGRKEQGDVSYEEPATDEIFSYTYEVEEEIEE